MPSITLHQRQPSSATVAAEPSQPRSRILILGKTKNERLALGRLLAHDFGRAPNSASDMDASFLSTRPSEASSDCAVSDKWVSAMAEPSSHATFWHPSATAVNNPAQFVDWLGRPLEALEAMINRAYPPTDGLGRLVGSALEDDFAGALFLFSAREYGPPQSSPAWRSLTPFLAGIL
jgi:hypothetical protein